MTTKDDTSGTLIRPPLLFLAALAAGLFADRWILPLDLTGLRWWTRQWIGGAMILLGMAVVVDCTRRFRRVGTHVQLGRPTTAIVESGLYRYSRNPIYLGLSTIHLGVAVADNNAWLPALLAPVLAVLRFGVIAREEAYLERKFGRRYEAYKARVRRWI